MRILFIIGLGSFIGGISRYLLSTFVQAKFLNNFPYGTITVNLLGSFLIGVIFALTDKGNFSPEWRLFLATGILGGFTTFSTFSNESIGMIQDGQFLSAGIYIISSVVLGLLATIFGIFLTKLL